jgi:uncharacterized protein YbaR (Trm112 family)
MVSETLQNMLRCPDDRSELVRADATLIARINARIASGRAVNRGGRTLAQPIDAGLVRTGGDILYPIVDGIPRLLIDEGIFVSQFELVADRESISRP